MTPTQPGRICFFGTYERDYLRNVTLIDGLKRSGWKVLECHAPLWEKERNKTGRYLSAFSLVLRAIELKLAYLRLLFKYVFKVGAYDVMMVGYIGHLDMPLAWLLTRLPRRPLVFSPLVSLYDTLVDDRRSFADGTLMSRFLRWLDRWTCARADLVLLDTDVHVDYFVNTFNLPRRRFARVLVGAAEPVLTGDPASRKPNRDAPFQVVFVGKFTPLHGLSFMLEAAQRFRDEPDILFHFVGSGQLTDEMHETVRRLALENVRIPGWIPYESVPGYLNRADVCLGIFGTTAKAARVIPGKVYEALSMGKAVVTADTPAIRELLTDGENAILCRRGDPEALARAIRRLYADRELLRRIAEGGSKVYMEKASVEPIGRSASVLLEKLVDGGVNAFR